MNKFLKDTILRYKIATGHQIRFQPGWDCHGLPIEMKALQAAHQSTNNESIDPLTIRRLCRQFANDAIVRQKQSMREWGLLANYDSPYLTMSPEFESNQLKVLANMVEKGLIYEARKPVHYSTSSKTALAEAELEYIDDYKSLSAFIKFKYSSQFSQKISNNFSKNIF